jgi:hypothetical protein
MFMSKDNRDHHIKTEACEKNRKKIEKSIKVHKFNKSTKDSLLKQNQESHYCPPIKRNIASSTTSQNKASIILDNILLAGNINQFNINNETIRIFAIKIVN